MPGNWKDEQRERIDELIDGYRVALHDSLNDLTEDEARRRLVPSRTTLLGLVKHASFVEGVWFDQAVTGRSYDEIGIAAFGEEQLEFEDRNVHCSATPSNGFRADRGQLVRALMRPQGCARRAIR